MCCIVNGKGNTEFSAITYFATEPFRFLEHEDASIVTKYFEEKLPQCIRLKKL